MEKTILITGCSSGIGYHAAHWLAARDWRVFATCRKEDDCERLRDEGLESFTLDYEETASIAAAVDQALNLTGGRLGAVFNNGAYAVPGAVEDLPTDGLRAAFEANFFGHHELTRRVIPAMRAQGWGRIVNCSSVLGFIPLKWRGAYVSSKFALEGLTDVLRIEMADTPIGVTLIEPGPITSRIRENSIPHFERWIDWQTSPRASLYAALRKRLYEKRGKDAFELPPEAVSRRLHKVLEARNPAPRVYVTTPTYLMGAAKRILTTRALDRIVSKS